jgi:succinate-acetate transporter protein
MGKKKYTNSPEYFIVIMYVSIIVLLTSIGLIYSCLKHSAYAYLALGIFGLIWGVLAFIEFATKKRVLPTNDLHRIREIIALIGLAVGVYILRTGSLSGTLNWREKMACIIVFAICFFALLLRGYIKADEKKE